MKALLSWLQDFAPIDGDPVEIGEQLSDLGMAVEQLDRLGEGLDGIVVAKVLATRPHPNADKIHLVDVDAGDGEAVQIVCGAFNMRPGDLVPLATVGTVMPNGIEIGRRKMRGEWSNGMLCSAREIGLGSDHAGIFLLPPGISDVGVRFADAMGIERDVLYDLGCGDGRIVITAAKRFGIRGVGIDIDPDRIAEAQENARQAGVADRVKFIKGDLFDADIKEATVVTLYLLPEVNLRLRPKLLSELKPGTRIVSHNYDMGDWKPERSAKLTVDGTEHVVYAWTIAKPATRSQRE